MTNRHPLHVLTGFFLLGFILLTIPSIAQNRRAAPGRKIARPSAASKLAEARRAIAEGNATAVRAWAKGEPAMFASAFADDALELRPDGSVVKGRQRILDLTKASMQRLGPGVELTVETTGVWLDGDTAYETGKSVYKYTAEGQPKTFETLFVSIWKKQRNGAWKLIVDMPVPVPRD